MTNVLTFFKPDDLPGSSLVMQQREKDNMTDYQKAGRNAKKRAKRTVNFFDPVANVASNEGYHISSKILIFISTLKCIF